MTSSSPSRLMAATLCNTKDRGRAIDDGASTKPALSSSDPPLDIEMTDVSATAPRTWGICPSSVRASFAAGEYGWYRDARRRGDVWNGGRVKLLDIGGPRSGDRSRVMGSSANTISGLSSLLNSSCGVIGSGWRRGGGGGVDTLGRAQNAASAKGVCRE
jgi:hypothetical protein